MDVVAREWDRRADESPEAFAAFAAYRDFGPSRSLDAVRKKVGKSARLMARWSSAWGWVERAAAYDEHMDRLAQGAAERAVTDRVVTLLRERDEWLAAKRERAAAMIRNGQVWAAFPPVDKETSVDGTRVVYKAAEPRTIVAGARLIAEGERLIAEAFRDALSAWLPSAPTQHNEGAPDDAPPTITVVTIRQTSAHRPPQTAGPDDGDAGPDDDGGWR